VAHVSRARGERVAVEDVDVLAALDGLGRRLERVRIPPGPLPLRLDQCRVVARRGLQCRYVSYFNQSLINAPDGTRTRI
jgi:hypothetical protein